MASPRIAPRPEADWDEPTRELIGLTTSGMFGSPLNIFTTLAHNPKLFRQWMKFGTAVLIQGKLPPREREIAVLRVGWLCESEYEFGQHVVIGRAAGLSDDEIRAIAAGPDDPSWSEGDRTILRATDELHDDYRIGDATWAAMSDRFGPDELIEFVMLVGQYHLVSMTLRTLGVELDEGVPGFADLGLTPEE